MVQSAIDSMALAISSYARTSKSPSTIELLALFPQGKRAIPGRFTLARRLPAHDLVISSSCKVRPSNAYCQPQRAGISDQDFFSLEKYCFEAFISILPSRPYQGESSILIPGGKNDKDLDLPCPEFPNKCSSKCPEFFWVQNIVPR